MIEYKNSKLYYSVDNKNLLNYINENTASISSENCTIVPEWDLKKILKEFYHDILIISNINILYWSPDCLITNKYFHHDSILTSTEFYGCIFYKTIKINSLMWMSIQKFHPNLKSSNVWYGLLFGPNTNKAHLVICKRYGDSCNGFMLSSIDLTGSSTPISGGYLNPNIGISFDKIKLIKISKEEHYDIWDNLEMLGNYNLINNGSDKVVQCNNELFKSFTNFTHNTKKLKISNQLVQQILPYSFSNFYNLNNNVYDIALKKEKYNTVESRIEKTLELNSHWSINNKKRAPAIWSDANGPAYLKSQKIITENIHELFDKKDRIFE